MANTVSLNSPRWRALGRLFTLLWAIPITLLVVIAVIALTWAMRSRVPESGQLTVPGLGASVIIGRDDATLPHIKAESEHDAWFAMGWLHASERGWQLAFNRRVVRGTLSERLGSATLTTDKTLRTLGLYRAAKRQFDGLPEETQNALIAYAKGVNAFFADDAEWLTPEFAILGEDPSTLAREGTWWTPEDSVGWGLVMALDLGGNWGKELLRNMATRTPIPGRPTRNKDRLRKALPSAWHL
jgi:penicillin G amidase